MHHHDSIIEAFLKRWAALINLASFVVTLLPGVYVLCRIPFYHRLRREAATELERDYSTAKLIACYLAGYAFIIVCLCAFSVEEFGRYWPAVSAKWLRGTGIGRGNHVVALISDAILCCLGSGLYYWIATTMGKTITAMDGRTVFIEAPRIVLQQRCAPLLAELAELDATAPGNQLRIKEITDLLALHRRIWR